MVKNMTNRKRKDIQDCLGEPRTTDNTKVFREFQKALEKEIESALLEKMQAFTDEILKSRLR